MKKYKRTRIIANLAVMGSLAWSSTTFAAGPAPITWDGRVKDNTNISISSPRMSYSEISSNQRTRKKKDRAGAIRLKQGMHFNKNI